MMSSANQLRATEFLQQSQNSFLRWKQDSMPLLQQSLELNPESVLSHVTRGLYLHMGRNVNYASMLRESLLAAQRHCSDDPIDRLYVAALQAADAGDLTRMVYCLEQVLLEQPTNAFALRMCQAELFWLGEMRWSEAISAGVEKHWSREHADYGSFMSIRAFDLEETGQYEKAQRCGRAAVDLDPSDPWGTHAVAHALFMLGEHQQGAQWLDGLQNNWGELSQIKLHLWWHRSLFSIEQNEYEAALDIYDQSVRNLDLPMIAELPDLYIDLQNAASLLLRLEMSGLAVSGRWEELADIAEKRRDDHSSPFTSAHYAVILAAAGREQRCQQLLESIRAASLRGGTLGPRIGNATLPSAIAAIAHRGGDHRKVVEALMPARHLLWQMGGSHAQRELFFLILADSLTQLGESGLLSIVQRDIEAAGFADSMAQRYSAPIA